MARSGALESKPSRARSSPAIGTLYSAIVFLFFPFLYNIMASHHIFSSEKAAYKLAYAPGAGEDNVQQQARKSAANKLCENKSQAGKAWAKCEAHNQQPR